MLFWTLRSFSFFLFFLFSIFFFPILLCFVLFFIILFILFPFSSRQLFILLHYYSLSFPLSPPPCLVSPLFCFLFFHILFHPIIFRSIPSLSFPSLFSDRKYALLQHRQHYPLKHLLISRHIPFNTPPINFSKSPKRNDFVKVNMTIHVQPECLTSRKSKGLNKTEADREMVPKQHETDHVHYVPTHVSNSLDFFRVHFTFVILLFVPRKLLSTVPLGGAKLKWT